VQVLTLQWLEFPSCFYTYLVINKRVNNSHSLNFVTSLSPNVFSFWYTGILGHIPRQIPYRESWVFNVRLVLSSPKAS